MDQNGVEESTKRLGDEMRTYVESMKGEKLFGAKTPEDVLRYVADQRVESISLWFSDLRLCRNKY